MDLCALGLLLAGITVSNDDSHMGYTSVLKYSQALPLIGYTFLVPSQWWEAILLSSSC
jgi:hypothetical protein